MTNTLLLCLLLFNPFLPSATLFLLISTFSVFDISHNEHHFLFFSNQCRFQNSFGRLSGLKIIFTYSLLAIFAVTESFVAQSPQVPQFKLWIAREACPVVQHTPLQMTPYAFLYKSSIKYFVDLYICS